MADVTPFRSITYRDDIALDDVVAPPYDVLTAAQASALRERSPFNANHIDLPVLPGAEASDELYTGAAETFRGWLAEGVLVRAEEPGILVIDQTYAGPDGRERTRRGFVARLRLAALDERIVLPHERTHAGPKLDRLRLYSAAHADLSQIFLLYADDDGGVGEALDAAVVGLPESAWREARDGDGNRHRMARIVGRDAAAITTGLADQPVYIADGHHRYETALAYRDERRAAGDASADTLMVYLCSLRDRGLTVFPTHRLLRGLEPLTLAALSDMIAPYFSVIGEPARGAAACRAALTALPEHADPTRVLGLYLPDEQICLTVTTREPAASDRLTADGFSPAAAGLSVTVLHELLFHEALGLPHADVERCVDYAKSVPDALAALGGGDYQLGAFLNATEVDQVRAIADAGEVMPQKSTYFYPKLLTGLAFDALGG